MLRIPLLLALLLICSSCKRESSKELDLSQIDLHVLNFDKYKVNRPHEDYQPVFPNEFESYALTKEEIAKSEKVLSQLVDDFNRKDPDETIQLNEYGRQYIGVKSTTGQRYVYINCFCQPERFPERNDYLVRVTDGGVCYFQIKIDLSNWKAFDFTVNGEA